MFLNKSLLILFISSILSFQKSYAQESKIFIIAENLHGRAKQIIEIKKSVVKEFKEEKNTYNILNYNRMNREISYNEINRGSRLAIIRYFDDRYVQPIEDTTNLILIDRFSSESGNKIGSSYYHKDTSTIYCKNIYDYFGPDLNIRMLRIYTAKDSLVFKQAYKYDQKGNLVAVTNSYGENSVPDKLIITYLAFDKKGNWTKRIEKSIKNKKVILTYRVERKITYY